MIKAINKGYTITVVSWENDADHYQTNSITVDTKEEAKVYYDLMQLCRSPHRSPKEEITVGGESNFSTEQKEAIVKFLRDNLDLVYDKTASDEELVDEFGEIAGELIGYSEFYVCRVMDSCTITYSPEDVYVEEIKF